MYHRYIAAKVGSEVLRNDAHIRSTRRAAQQAVSLSRAPCQSSRIAITSLCRSTDRMNAHAPLPQAAAVSPGGGATGAVRPLRRRLRIKNRAADGSRACPRRQRNPGFCRGAARCRDRTQRFHTLPKTHDPTLRHKTYILQRLTLTLQGVSARLPHLRRLAGAGRTSSRPHRQQRRRNLSAAQRLGSWTGGAWCRWAAAPASPAATSASPRSATARSCSRHTWCGVFSAPL